MIFGRASNFVKKIFNSKPVSYQKAPEKLQSVMTNSQLKSLKKKKKKKNNPSYKIPKTPSTGTGVGP